MRVGFSSYSFHQYLGTGRMSLPEVFDWAKEAGAAHIEIAAGFASDNPMSDLSDLPNNRPLVDAIKAAQDKTGLPIAQIALPATFWTKPETADGQAPGAGGQSSSARGIEAELDRVRAHIDLCAELGVGLLRHDVSHGNHSGDDLPLFEQALPVIVEHSKTIAQYAATKGVRTSIENHGFFVQGSERVRRVIHAVDEPNFGTTLDIGNFLCLDENPVVATKNNIAYANIVHFKDFYIRQTNPGLGFFGTRGGQFLRGAIVGQGDIDIPAVAKVVKESGYDDFITIEFEGIEDALPACKAALENTRRILDEA
ncbi:sugar phosphate isomerase/epimerase family protein [Aestuariimicrobium sp. T2.26MG-19.2B]|uniref:sugar phosphate isomerase/epimerase family protein n=1 Tax=Aestuariimicrobium sp. T2.26MG-19.2B TaxID=3040679 RepID=UPI0024774617|nr:sugar phosphate isomerase/epimerase family protein [Aestuariimicrobium sp. T2.26MG-19.2B]CAI9404118.1 Inosose dehydratase [Aestuariimicrobium sp. T2.26MG-19.2B]